MKYNLSTARTAVPTISTGVAAARLGVHAQTIRRYCENGDGFGVRVLGNRWHVIEARVAELEQKLLACGTTGTASK